MKPKVETTKNKNTCHFNSFVVHSYGNKMHNTRSSYILLPKLKHKPKSKYIIENYFD